MKASGIILSLLTVASTAHALVAVEGDSAQGHDLFKRKGGGGGGGRGGGGTTSGGKGSSSSGSIGRGSTTSNVGGRTTTGSGVTPRFGGGKYYGGGASVPYKAGSRSPSGIIPLAILGGGLLFWSGLWLSGAYLYAFNNPYRFFNATADPPINETLPVYCICQPYDECSCDENNDPAWLNDIVGNGSYAALNDTLVFVGDVNGTKGIYVNGTLPNGTTAAGGDEDPNAAIHLVGMINAVGFWPVALAVGAVVFM